MKKIIKTNNAPGAIGPYSQAVVAGNFLYISGQIPIDPATGDMVGGGISEQTSQSLKNIGGILREAGYDYCDVVKTTVLLQNMTDFSAMNEVYSTFFTNDPPARAAFQAAALPKNAMVEIEAVAYKE